MRSLPLQFALLLTLVPVINCYYGVCYLSTDVLMPLIPWYLTKLLEYRFLTNQFSDIFLRSSIFLFFLFNLWYTLRSFCLFLYVAFAPSSLHLLDNFQFDRFLFLQSTNRSRCTSMTFIVDWLNWPMLTTWAEQTQPFSSVRFAELCFLNVQQSSSASKTTVDLDYQWTRLHQHAW